MTGIIFINIIYYFLNLRKLLRKSIILDFISYRPSSCSFYENEFLIVTLGFYKISTALNTSRLSGGLPAPFSVDMESYFKL